jgi:hypothetical protein
MEGEPTMVALANGWIIINVGGGPTDDRRSSTRTRSAATSAIRTAT